MEILGYLHSMNRPDGNRLVVVDEKEVLQANSIESEVINYWSNLNFQTQQIMDKDKEISNLEKSLRDANSQYDLVNVKYKNISAAHQELGLQNDQLSATLTRKSDNHQECQQRCTALAEENYSLRTALEQGEKQYGEVLAELNLYRLNAAATLKARDDARKEVEVLRRVEANANLALGIYRETVSSCIKERDQAMKDKEQAIRSEADTIAAWNLVKQDFSESLAAEIARLEACLEESRKENSLLHQWSENIIKINKEFCDGWECLLRTARSFGLKKRAGQSDQDFLESALSTGLRAILPMEPCVVRVNVGIDYAAGRDEVKVHHFGTGKPPRDVSSCNEGNDSK